MYWYVCENIYMQIFLEVSFLRMIREVKEHAYFKIKSVQKLMSLRFTLWNLKEPKTIVEVRSLLDLVKNTDGG